MNKYAPAASNFQVNDLNDAIVNLTQQIGQITQALANQANPARRASFQNNGAINFQPTQTQQFTRGVCFNCGQPRHIKRSCPEFVTPNISEPDHL